MISNKTWPNPIDKNDLKTNTLNILKEVNGIESSQCGHTKIFISDPQIVFSLEEKRLDKINKFIAIILQKVFFFI